MIVAQQQIPSNFVYLNRKSLETSTVQTWLNYKLTTSCFYITLACDLYIHIGEDELLLQQAKR